MNNILMYTIFVYEAADIPSPHRAGLPVIHITQTNPVIYDSYKTAKSF